MELSQLKKQWAARPPPQALFFAPLEIDLTSGELEVARFAYFISKHGHEGQSRDNGARYFDHPKAAAWLYINELGGRDLRLIVDILLHDIPEEKPTLLSLFRTKLNFGEDATKDVVSMTKLPKDKETTEQYLGRIIARGPWAITAKLCDRLDNMRTLEACTADKRQRQIEETQAYHLPLLIPALRAYAGPGKPWSNYDFKKLIGEAIDAYMQD